MDTESSEYIMTSGKENYKKNEFMIKYEANE